MVDDTSKDITNSIGKDVGKNVSGIEIPGFEIRKEIGRGGMARVHLAVQKKFGRLVALKVVSADYSRDSRFKERFIRESRINARLTACPLFTHHR